MKASSLLLGLAIGSFVIFGTTAALLTVQSCHQGYSLSNNQYDCLIRQNMGLFAFGEVAFMAAGISIGYGLVVKVYETMAA